jgi:hypothetical protein
MNLIQYRNTLLGGQFIVLADHVRDAAHLRRIKSMFFTDLYERVLCN